MKLLKWFVSLLPCWHDFEKLTYPPRAIIPACHYFKCKKCGIQRPCDCPGCMSPWETT